MSKELPILFSTDMVQAILQGRKTVTRRVLKVPMEQWEGKYRFPVPKGLDSDAGFAWCTNPAHSNLLLMHCPCGEPGDVLWVREGFISNPHSELEKHYYSYKADYPKQQSIRWKPSIHMPKEAARIWLRVKDIRVERLQDITDSDAIAEGIEIEHDDGPLSDSLYKSYTGGLPVDTAKKSFCTLWWQINGRDSWMANPWVWVITFTVLSTTGYPFSKPVNQSTHQPIN